MARLFSGSYTINYLVSLYFFIPSLVFASAGSSSLRVHPHSYADSRGAEPNFQAIGLAKAEFTDPEETWQFQFHLEGESAGRRDVSIDLDRGWYRPYLGLGHYLTLGRIHPYDLMKHPAATNAWGLLASSEPQNFGLQLGYGYHSLYQPSPNLMGWLGIHYGYDLDDSCQIGISATPFFLPSMGAEISLSNDAPVSVGRFARRPPGTVILEGRTYPIRYEVDRSQLFMDVILNPQVAAHFRTNGGSQYFESWTVVGRSPSLSPQFKSEEYLIIKGEALEAFARIRPMYPQRFWASETVTIKNVFPLNPSATVRVTSDNFWGYEFKLSNEYFYVSLLNESRFAPDASSFTSNEVRYADYLGQTEWDIPLFGSVSLYSGLRYHFIQRDFWGFGGFRFQIFKHAQLDTGVDLFSGDEATYFGEWRTNNRVGTALTWEIGS